MKIKLSIVLAAFFLTGCSSVLVKRDYEPTTDFSALKSFAWQYSEQPKSDDPGIDNDLNNERIRDAINATLQGKGFQLVESGTSDFLVGYFVENKRTLSSSSASVGVGRSSAGRYGSVGYDGGVSEYDQAILTIDIMNPSDQKNNMAWCGFPRGIQRFKSRKIDSDY